MHLQYSQSLNLAAFLISVGLSLLCWELEWLKRSVQEIHQGEVYKNEGIIEWTKSAMEELKEDLEEYEQRLESFQQEKENLRYRGLGLAGKVLLLGYILYNLEYI